MVSSRSLQPTRVEPGSSLPDAVLSITTLFTSSSPAVVATGLPPVVSISPTLVATSAPTAAPSPSPSPGTLLYTILHHCYDMVSAAW